MVLRRPGVLLRGRHSRGSFLQKAGLYDTRNKVESRINCRTA